MTTTTITDLVIVGGRLCRGRGDRERRSQQKQRCTHRRHRVSLRGDLERASWPWDRLLMAGPILRETDHGRPRASTIERAANATRRDNSSDYSNFLPSDPREGQ